MRQWVMNDPRRKHGSILERNPVDVTDPNAPNRPAIGNQRTAQPRPASGDADDDYDPALTAILVYLGISDQF